MTGLLVLVKERFKLTGTQSGYWNLLSKGGNPMLNTGVVIKGQGDFTIQTEYLTKCPVCGQTATKRKKYCCCPHCQKIYYDEKQYEKKYPEILDQLEDFVKEKYGVYVFSFEQSWFGISCTGMVFNAYYKVIFLESNLPVRRRVTGLAHEIGHAIDFFQKFEGNFELWKETMENDILSLEKNAWHHAEKLLKMFSFTDWEYFEKHKEEGLKSYEEEEVM
jgi:hypothetical protein